LDGGQPFWWRRNAEGSIETSFGEHPERKKASHVSLQGETGHIII
jgi:hypothetical protein